MRPTVYTAFYLRAWEVLAGASKGTLGDAKCVTEIVVGRGGTKIRKLGVQSLPFCFKGK